MVGGGTQYIRVSKSLYITKKEMGGGGREGMHPPTVCQKQVPSPVNEKWVPITKNMVFSMVYPFFGQRSCTIFIVQILLLSILC